MSVQHFKSLLFKSTQIQQEIEKEQNRRLPDWIHLLKLKKLRLVIRDRLEEIARKETQLREERQLRSVLISHNERGLQNYQGAHPQ